MEGAPEKYAPSSEEMELAEELAKDYEPQVWREKLEAQDDWQLKTTLQILEQMVAHADTPDNFLSPGSRKNAEMKIGLIKEILAGRKNT